MKNCSSSMIVVMALLMTLSCSSGEKQTSENVLDFSLFKVKHLALSHFSEYGKIKKVIKLETNDKSVFGSIDRLRIDNKTGDILIGDFDTRKQVLRFNKDGNFLTSYGKVGEGPSEHHSLLDFCTNENGEVVLLTDSKLIKYSMTGSPLLETKINVFGEDIETFQDKIFVSILGYDNKPKEKKALQVYNSFLVNIGGIGEYEERFEIYRFGVLRKMAVNHDRLYFIEHYDFELNVYDLNSQKISQLRIPNNNSVLDKVWEKRHFVEADRTEIKSRLHRFDDIYSLKNELLLHESWKEKKVYNIWRLNLDKKEAVIYSMFSFYKDWEIKNPSQLFFSYFVGTYENAVIAVFLDSDDFNKYKGDYPALKTIDFKLDDNPILAFYEFNEAL